MQVIVVNPISKWYLDYRNSCIIPDFLFHLWFSDILLILVFFGKFVSNVLLERKRKKYKYRIPPESFSRLESPLQASLVCSSYESEATLKKCLNELIWWQGTEVTTGTGFKSRGVILIPTLYITYKSSFSSV